MGARYPHGACAGNELGQRHLTGHDGQAQLPRSGQFGVPRGDSGGYDHGSDPGQVTRVMPLGDPDAQGGQIGGAGGVSIASTHGNSTATGDECEGAHPGSADSHEVDSALIRGVEQSHVWWANCKMLLQVPKVRTSGK